MPADVLLDEPVGCGDDLGRGAVVLLELDHPGTRPAAGEVEDVGDLGAPPGVDRLVVIADHADARVVAGEGREDPFLDAAGVLILVDEEVVEPAGLGAANLLVGCEEFVDEQKQVVEVDCPGRLEGFLIAAVAGGGERPGVVGICRQAVEGGGGADRPALPPAHAVNEVARREHGVGYLERLERRAGRGLLLTAIDDGKPLRIAELRGVPSQDPHTQGVDRGDLGPLRGLVGSGLPTAGRTQQTSRSGEHLAGGLVRKRDSENPRRPGPLPHEVGDPGDHHPRFARARAGEHEQRPGRRENRLRLGGVEPLHAHLAGRGGAASHGLVGGGCHGQAQGGRLTESNVAATGLGAEMRRVRLDALRQGSSIAPFPWRSRPPRE